MTLIVPLAPELLVPVVEMIRMQQEMQYALDPRLPLALSAQEISSLLCEQVGSGLVAISDREEVCGYGHPGIWQGRAQDLLSPFLSGQIGRVRQLTLHPERETGNCALALLFAFREVWKSQNSEADLICWPVCDRRIEPLLLAQGFELDHVCTFAAKGTLFTQQPFCPPSLVIRPVQRMEEEAVLNLYGEELEYLHMHSAFVRPDEALVAFDEHLMRVLSDEQHEDTPIILVAEKDSQLVGMICFHHFTNTASMHLEFLPRGRYGSLDVISVPAESVELDIRRHLVQAAITHLEPLGLDGWLHCHHVFDPFVHSFWKRQGFSPLWLTYGRLSHS